MTPEDIIDTLGLEPHPEGGWFRETFRADAGATARGASTAIYYLLKAEEQSRWHRVIDADEVWNWYAGASLELRLSDELRGPEEIVLGSDLIAGERPQAVVPKGVWQSARPRDGWVLVGCIVAPAFRFEGFEMAPVGWEPERG